MKNYADKNPQEGGLKHNQRPAKQLEPQGLKA